VISMCWSLQRRHKLFLVLICCLALASQLIACHNAEVPAASAATLPVVPVALVSRGKLSNELTLTAEFTPYQNVDVMAKVAGYVKSISVDLGDHVRQGQVLAVLEVPELRDEMAKEKAAVLAAQANVLTAKSGIVRAQASASMAHLSFTRIEDVSKKEPGLVPRQEVDVAQAHDQEAAAALASARSALQSAEQSNLQATADKDRAASMLEYSIIRAPFDGVVTKRYADTGSMIQAGTASQTQAMPLVRLAQNNVLRLTLPVPVSSVASIHTGEPVDVNVVTLGRSFKGTVTRFADSLQMSTRTMDTEIDVPNRDDKLVPGMYAEAHLHLADRPDVLNIPIDAVDGLGTSSQHAYVVRDGRIALITISTGVQTPDRVEILSGLREGDKVVVGRHSDLSDGQRVETKLASYDSQPTAKT
jgi:RND family efflux transporter MFP subunit